MKIFKEKLNDFYAEFGDSKIMVLSSAYENKVSSRMMSIVFINGRFYFQTDKNFRKYEQIISNPNIALCADNVQIEGVCKEVGKPSDNIKFIKIFKKKYEGSYEKYSNLKDEVLFEISPVYIERWLYIDNISYIEKFEFEKQRYTIDRYDVGEKSKLFLETDRLILRNVKPADVDIMYDYRNNEICSKYQRDQTKTREGLINLINEHTEDELSLKDNVIIAVELKEIQEMIGEIVVMPSEKTISLGYTFSYKHHRKGYAYEALYFLIGFLHNKYPEFEFICFTEKENIASMNLLKKLGYEHLGYLESKSSEVFVKYMEKGYVHRGKIN